MTTVTFTGDGDPLDDLERVMRRLTNPTAADLEIFTDAIREGFAQNFANESTAGGQAWKKLAPMTVRERKKRGYPGEHPILVQSGDLLNSLVNPNHPQHITEIVATGGGWAVSVGSNDDRVVKLDAGEDRIPARPFLDVERSLLDNAAENFFAMLMGR